MQLAQRRRFNSTQDWHNYVAEQQGKLNPLELSALRKSVYSDIENLRGRPLLIYITKFVGNVPQGAPINIDLEDIDGFTDLINSVKPEFRTVDILLHSPGGRPDAVERIVHLLRNRFDEVHFLIPHSAYSAATMLALSGNTISLHPSASLGPIDPQIGGIPARSIKRGFEKVKQKIKQEGPEALPAYIPLIEKYSIDLLEVCEDSEKLAKLLVSEWLGKYMFADKKRMGNKIKSIVEFFSDYDEHLLHSRPLFDSKLKKFDMPIITMEGDLKDLTWEAYILLNGFLGISPFVKLYESNDGISWGKQYQEVMIPAPPNMTIPLGITQ